MSRATWLLPIAIAVIAGCGDLDTAYGQRDGTSVNGARVLHGALAGWSDLRDAWLLSPRLAERDLLVHLATGTELPTDAACTWLGDWLAAGSAPRQAVVILRDGNVAPWLCRRWAGEATVEHRDDLAARLRRRAELEEHDRQPASGPPLTTDLFTLVRGGPQPVQHLTGLGLSAPPPTLTLGASLDPGKDGESLLIADGRPLAVAWPVGEHGRLVVVATATGLLDGALADIRGRAFAGALLSELQRWHGAARPAAAWVGSLRVREKEPEDLDLLSFLRRGPFGGTLWHLLALLVLVVLGRAAWLGRREAPRTATRVRFATHVDALARHLARDPARAAGPAATAIAAAWGRAAPPVPPTSAGDARAWLAAPTSTAPTTSVTTASESDHER